MSDSATKVNIYKDRIFPVLFMFIVTVVFITVVSGIYLTTRERVLRNEELYLKTAVLFAANIEVPEEPAAQEELYNERIDEVRNDQGVIQYYEVGTAGSPTGYVLPVSGPGVWGEIEAVVGFDAGLNRLTGVDFIAQNETPGLGARITERWFRVQFRGKTGPFTRVPEGTEGESATEFDAITGATLTSKSVQQILNEAVQEAPEIIEGE